MIYFYQARGTNLYKIGYTKREASERLKEWQAGCPYKLDLVGTIQGTRSDEKKLHDRLRRQGYWKSDAAGREWFALSKETVEQLLGHTLASPVDPVLDFVLQVGEDVVSKQINNLSRRKGLHGVVGSVAKTFWKNR
ncbi:MAG: GIY-YIG nuclease family protein [Snowella sp.]|nr:GIY-YIG nuclease family protein [Snowella sp.]